MSVFVSKSKNLKEAIREYKHKAAQKKGYYNVLRKRAMDDPTWPWKCTNCGKRMGQKQYETQKSYNLNPTCNWCYTRSQAPKENKYMVEIVLK